MSYLDRIISAIRDSIVWAGFDLQRPDGAAAQAVVLIDPATNDAYSAASVAQANGRIAVTGSYIVETSFIGGAAGDVLTCTQIIDTAGEAPTTLAVLWRNQTTGVDLVGAPPTANIAAIGSRALSDEQLRASPISVAVSTSAEVEVKNDAGSPLSVSPVAQSYVDKTVPAIAASQASGTSAVIGVNAARKAVVIVPPADCTLCIASGATSGVPLYGGIPNSFVGSECPANALFISGLTAGQSVVIWEA